MLATHTISPDHILCTLQRILMDHGMIIPLNNIKTEKGKKKRNYKYAHQDLWLETRHEVCRWRARKVVIYKSYRRTYSECFAFLLHSRDVVVFRSLLFGMERSEAKKEAKIWSTQPSHHLIHVTATTRKML